MNEASRYLIYHNHSFFFSLELQGVFSSTPFLGPDELEEAFSGSKGSTTGAIDWDPLRVVPIEDLLVLDGRKEPP